MKSFYISCGGTGGHLAPGISLAEGLMEKGHRCSLFISQKEVDSRLVRKYSNLIFNKVPSAPFSLSPIRFIRFLVQQTKAFLYYLFEFNKNRPDTLIAFGGFCSLGSVLAASFTKTPIVLHEANRFPGKAIRLLSGKASRVYLPKGITHQSIPQNIVKNCGYPLRKEITKIPKAIAREQIGVKAKGKLLVIIGGSQGADTLNQWVLSNFSNLSEAGINVYCVTGLKNEIKGELQNQSLETNLKFVPFTDQMAAVLSSADLVISRAGAGGISEIVRCRVPNILIPYPHAADNHQEKNARHLEKTGCSIVVPQEKIDTLFREVTDTINNTWLIDKFCSNLKNVDSENSLEIILDDLESISDKKDLKVTSTKGDRA